MSAPDTIAPGASAATESDARSEPLAGRRDSTGRRESLATEASAEPSRSVSTKRRLSETELTASASKRQRADDPAPPPVLPQEKSKEESIGALFAVPQKPYPISRPHPSQDLISLFGLNDTAAGVARLDPATGLKNTANKLRKSYAKHIKDLPGSHEAPKNPGELKHFVEWPEEMYFAERRMNREVEKGFPENLSGKLDRAVQLVAGRLSATEEAKWQAYINQTEDTSKATAVQAAGAGHASSTAQRPYSASTPAGAPSRSRRSGAKRRYDDDSFEGYSESFADEGSAAAAAAAAATALRAGEDEADGSSAMRKKQSRKRDNAQPHNFSDRMSQYSPSAVSIGYGSYAAQ